MGTRSSTCCRRYVASESENPEGLVEALACPADNEETRCSNVEHRNTDREMDASLPLSGENGAHDANPDMGVKSSGDTATLTEKVTE